MKKKLVKLLKSIEFKKNSALSFSGGLDSGIIAYLMRDYGVTLYTAGIEGSRDIDNAVESSEILSLPLKIIYVDEKKIIEGISFLRNIEPSINPVEVGFDLPLYFISKYADEKNIYTGQGADELFGGYKKYLKNPSLMEQDQELLIKRTLPRERKIAEKFKKILHTPYLSNEILNFARNLDLKYKIRDGERKWILRESAKIIGVPEEIVKREKKAAQYGSGIWKIMKRMAKKRGMKLDEFILLCHTNRKNMK